MAKVSRFKTRQSGTAVIFDADHSEGMYAAVQALHAIFEAVVIVTPRDTIATEMQLVTRQGVLRRMAELHIRIIPLASIVWSDSFEDGILRYENVYTGEGGAITDVSFLAYATPRRPNDELARPLRDRQIEVLTVGDCRSAAELLSATATGHAAGNAV